jgi:hypothetical protein
MQQAAGIKEEKDIKSEVHTFADSKKFENGAKSSILPKTDFQIKCEQAISLEEGRKICQDYLKEIWKK